MKQFTFSFILKEILNEENLNLKKYCDLLNNLGLSITYPSLYAYYNGVTTPSFLTAKRILKLSKYKINDDELEQILDFSKKSIKADNSENSRILNLNLKIKPKQISEKYEFQPSTLKSLIDVRSRELFTTNEKLMKQFDVDGRSKLSAYIAYLIKKDLEENKIL